MRGEGESEAIAWKEADGVGRKDDGVGKLMDVGPYTTDNRGIEPTSTSASTWYRRHPPIPQGRSALSGHWAWIG